MTGYIPPPWLHPPGPPVAAPPPDPNAGQRYQRQDGQSTWPHSSMAPPMTSYNLRGREMGSASPRHVSAFSPLPAGYQRKALPLLPNSHATVPDRVHGGGGGDGALLPPEAPDTFRWRPPPAVALGSSAQTKASAYNIRQLIGLAPLRSDGPGGSSNSPNSAALPTLHRSSQKIRQLTGLDLGSSGAGIGGDSDSIDGGGSQRGSRGASPLFASSPLALDPPPARSSASSPGYEFIRDPPPTPSLPPPPPPPQQQSDWSGGSLADLRRDGGSSVYSDDDGDGDNDESGPSGIPGRPGDYEDSSASAAASTAATAHVAPLRIEKPAQDRPSLAAFSERDLLEYLALDDVTADDPYYGADDEDDDDDHINIHYNGGADAHNNDDDDDDDDDDVLDTRDLYHASAAQLAESSAALSPPPPPPRLPPPPPPPQLHRGSRGVPARVLRSAFDTDSDSDSPGVLHRTNEHLHQLVASARRTAGLLGSRDERRREQLRHKIRVITEGRDI